VIRTRREFLAEVGRTMITASVGVSAASQLALGSTFVLQDPEPLAFGALEPLVDLLLATPPDKLLPLLADKLRAGTKLDELVTAAALANARTFGGEDYVGFHTMMALAPAYAISRELPAGQQPLPVFKVLWRNANRLGEFGGRKNEVLHAAPAGAAGVATGEALRGAVRDMDLAAAERAFAGAAAGTPQGAFDALQVAVQDATEVHRVALAHRAWDLLSVVGMQHAQTLLRQSVHYLVKNEKWSAEHHAPVRAMLPQLLDKHGLLAKEPGRTQPDDAWLERTSLAIFGGTPADAAGIAAEALAAGTAPEAVGEAIALAANQLLLRDHGRRENEVQPNKPLGSVHGDSIGLHACDSANAWRGLARAGNPRNTFASLICGAWQAARDRVERGGDFLAWQPWPLPEHRARVTAKDPGELLTALDAAVKANDQAASAAVVQRCGELGHPSAPLFDLLRRYAISEDGALHAEKYFRTATEEFAAGRPAFRWRHLVSLARVTASEHGYPAPGYQEARELLQV
jgi:hypothetical protein